MGQIQRKSRQKRSQNEDPRPDIAIGHMGLRVSELKASVAFFELVGGRTVVHMPGMAIIELRGGTHLILRHNPGAGQNYAGFDLMVDDVDDMRQRLLEAGFHPSGFSQGGVHRSFSVTDPSGIELDFTSSHATGPI